AKAVQLAYDPFDDVTAGQYTDGPISGQNPTIGPASPSFFSGGWNLQGNAAADPGPTVVSTSLSYKGSPSIGGSVSGPIPGVGTGYGRAERFLRTPWDGSTDGTFYMGFEVNFGTVGADGAMGYHAVEMFPPGVSPGENRNFDIGYNQFDGSVGPA